MSDKHDQYNEPVDKHDERSQETESQNQTGVIDKNSRDNGKSSGPRRSRILLVRYGRMGHVGQFRHSEREIPYGTSHVVIKTERGLEIGEIISPFCHHRGVYKLSDEDLTQFFKDSGPNYPVTKNGMVVRFASENDLKDQDHLNANARNELKVCQGFVDKLNLPMKLVDAEHLFGGERIIFYFMADGRIDFRDLVKELAHHYQTRIEMRQIGARDEARLIADYETCGRECCCKNFLKVLQPVNMRMAKLQKATLDPSKISGRCGRLKCCLRYEDEVYTDLNKRLPRKNSCVLTEFGHGTVVDTQVLTQLVKVRLARTARVVAINVDEIMEKNYRPTEEDEKALEPRRGRERRAKPRETEETEVAEKKAVEEPTVEKGIGVDADETESREQPEKRGEDQGGDSPPKKRGKRRRRRRKKSGSGGKKSGSN